MQRFQRTLTATLAAAALLGTAAFHANAQTETPAVAAPAQVAPAPGHHGPRAPKVDLAKLHAQHMEHLKTLLQIQPSQQAAWDKYAKAMEPQPRAKAQGERPDLRKLTTPERLDLAQKLRKERMARAEQRDQATRAFYSSLNPSQQQAFDLLQTEHLRKGGMHKKGGHGKRFDGPRGHGPAGHPVPGTSAQ